MMQKWRDEFPFLKNGYIYLDSAATVQKPHSVIETISNFYANDYSTIHRGVYTSATHATELYLKAREGVRRYINASEMDSVVFVRSTTEAINLMAHSFPRAFMEEGDEILISEMEHHSNIVPWQLVCEERGLKLRVVAAKKDGSFDLEAFKQCLNERTKLVSVAHVTNTTGEIYPVEEIIELSHGVGAKVLLDGAQAVGHLPVDVQDLDVDFYAFSAHKMYGPTGIGVLYGKMELLEALPPYQGGGDMIESVSFSGTTYQDPPLRFEPGTPLIAQVIGLGAAIDFIEQVGLRAIYDWEMELTRYAMSVLGEIEGIQILGPKERGALVSFVIEGCHALDIATILNLKNIAIRSGNMCAEPAVRHFGHESILRASFALYNTKEEIDKLAEALIRSAMLV